MAAIHPSAWPSDAPRSLHAEKLLWRKLRDETPDDWHVVHSVGMTSHERKPWAEIDFVVIADIGVFCIEVKGGQIAVHDQVWTTNGKPLRESPFQQSGGGAVALHHELAARFKFMRKSIVGWGVAFPDVRFENEAAGIEQRLLYDDRDLGVPIEQFIRGLQTYWAEFHRHDKNWYRPLSPADRLAVLRWVSPSFDCVATLRSSIYSAEEELVRLTESQRRAAEAIATGDRAIISGGAGSGKTVLAIDEVRRAAERGAEILFICRSRPLASRLEQQFENASNVNVSSSAEFMNNLILSAGLSTDFSDIDPHDVEDVFLPERAYQAVVDGELDGKYDRVIVDEAQDLIGEPFLDLIDALVRGGLDAGCWHVYLDHRQSLFGTVDQTSLERLRRAQSCSEPRLTVNCRNTEPVAIMTSVFAGLPLDEVATAEGPSPIIKGFDGAAREGEAVVALVSEWLKQGVRANEIVVLGERPFQTSSLREMRIPATQGFVDATEGSNEDGYVGYAAVEDFKGLEATAVIVTEVTGLTSSLDLKRMYVACSRARALLALLIDDRLSDQRKMRFEEFVWHYSAATRPPGGGR